jgi:hypothetical protein
LQERSFSFYLAIAILKHPKPKSASMKSNSHPPLFFSAYPLKRFEQEVSATPPSKQSPYLKSVLTGKSSSASRTRILPMINPYTQAAPPAAPPKTSKLPKDIELTEKEWFNNYE